MFFHAPSVLTGDTLRSMSEVLLFSCEVPHQLLYIVSINHTHPLGGCTCYVVGFHPLCEISFPLCPLFFNATSCQKIAS